MGQIKMYYFRGLIDSINLAYNFKTHFPARQYIFNPTFYNFLCKWSEVSDIPFYRFLHTKKTSQMIAGFYCTFKTTYMLTFPENHSSCDSWSSPHPISNSQLHVLPHFHLCPIYLVVFKGVYFFRMGYLILRGASRLDAFSVYPFRAWLLGRRLGSLTDAPAARPSRSSRTKDSSSQISYAHAGQGANCLTTF